MRKLDYLRREFNKIKKGGKDVEKAIRMMDLPVKFMRKGDYEPPICLPYVDKFGVCGIAVEHNYEYEGSVFTYQEYFTFRRPVSIFE